MSEIDSQSETIKSRFARVYGSAGEAPRVMGILKAFWPLLVICLLLGYLIRAALPFPYLTLSQLGWALILLAVIGIFLLAMGDRRLGNYLKGAKGEEWVARELAFLPATFTVFNGIRIPDGQYNFDHILLGPSGIFVVETKNWSGHVVFSEGRVRVDEKEVKRSPLQQVKGEAAELDAFLQAQGHTIVPIQSVLCFLGSTLEEPITNVNGVIVCDGVSLTDVLTGELNEPADSALLEAIEHSLIPLVG